MVAPIHYFLVKRLFFGVHALVTIYVAAVWLLLTNLPARVVDVEVALWYHFRSRVESYHKLIQSAGMQLESWQQETAERIAKRLAVANMACALGRNSSSL